MFFFNFFTTIFFPFLFWCNRLQIIICPYVTFFSIKSTSDDIKKIIVITMWFSLS